MTSSEVNPENQKMTLKYNFLVAVLVFAFLSCSEDTAGDCLRIESEQVIAVDAPETGKVNEQVQMQVSFNVRNGCGNFEKFAESGSDLSRTVEAIARYEGCVCAQYIKNITVNYTFTPQAPGDYEFKFVSGENETIMVNLSIL